MKYSTKKLLKIKRAAEAKLNKHIAGVAKVIETVTPKLNRILGSRLTEEPYNLKPSEMGGGGGSKFLGLPLPLLPDISKSQVEVGVDQEVLKIYGIKQRADTKVSLWKGPNRKSNRYLKFQYARMIQSIGGTLQKTGKASLTVKTNFDLDSIKRLGPQEDKFGRTIPRKVVWTFKIRELMKSSLSRVERKALKKRSETYWRIGMDLLVNSQALRLALFNKTMSRHGWLHRNYEVWKLEKFNKQYKMITKQFLQNQPVGRVWIPQGESWRPLGIASLPWRVYTRGLGNLMEVFLRNGWPDHQHGYTTGRGVHTAWTTILHKVIKARNIYEFDFVGFFNNVNLTSVAENLKNVSTPKWIAIHFLNLVASDVVNIDEETLNVLSAKESWVAMWKKHEYIHKFRENWRYKGLAQGSTISPLLSVLPLIVLEDLSKLGIYYVSYADDGILYGLAQGDYGAIMQQMLDKSNVGAIVHPIKSRWVKKDNIWLTKLKFVGLIYDPWTKILSACTRGGATLDLSINTVVLVDKDLPHVSPWEDDRNHILKVDYEEPVYQPLLWLWILILIFPSTMCLVFLVLTSMTVLLVQDMDYHKPQVEEWTLSKIRKGCTLNPMHKEILKEAAFKEFQHRLDTTELVMQEKHRYSLAMEDPNKSPTDWTGHIASPTLWYWFSIYKELDPKGVMTKFNTILPIQVLDEMDSKILEWEPVQESEFDTPEGQFHLTSGAIKSLVWFKHLALPQGVLDKVGIPALNKKMGDFKLIDHIPRDLEEMLPKDLLEVKNWTLKHGWEATLAISTLGWESVYNTQLFGTFIARLFVNSFKNEGVIQDFKMEYREDSIMDHIDRSLGKKYVSKLLGVPLNVFNSTSVTLAYAMGLMKQWDKEDGYMPVNKYWEIAHASVQEKIQFRRTGWTPRDYKMETPTKGLIKLLMSLAELRKESQGTGANCEPQFPLSPFNNMPAPKGKYKEAIKAKVTRLGKALHWDTIINSNTPEFRRGNNLDNFWNKKPANTDWCTWAPYTKGPRAKKSTLQNTISLTVIKEQAALETQCVSTQCVSKGTTGPRIIREYVNKLWKPGQIGPNTTDAEHAKAGISIQWYRTGSHGTPKGEPSVPALPMLNITKYKLNPKGIPQDPAQPA